jgi:hypothetical protein
MVLLDRQSDGNDFQRSENGSAQKRDDEEYGELHVRTLVNWHVWSNSHELWEK